MNIATLETIKRLRNLNDSQVAKMAGVSRQAVSLWRKGSTQIGDDRVANLRSVNLIKLGESLGLGVERLIAPVRFLNDKKIVENLEAQFNWDKSFGSFRDFLVALLSEDLRALSRFVQIVGLFEAATLLGNNIWKRFDLYKRFMHPKRREQCEKIWMIQKSLNLI